MEIKTQRNYVYEPCGRDNITAGRRAAEAKDGRTRGAVGRRMEKEEAETRENDAGDVVVIDIKIGTAVCKNFIVAE